MSGEGDRLGCLRLLSPQEPSLFVFFAQEPSLFPSGATYSGGFFNGKFDGEGDLQMGRRGFVCWRLAREQNARAGSNHWRLFLWSQVIYLNPLFFFQGKYVDTETVIWAGQFHNGMFFNGKSYITLR